MHHQDSAYTFQAQSMPKHSVPRVSDKDYLSTLHNSAFDHRGSLVGARQRGPNHEAHSSLVKGGGTLNGLMDSIDNANIELLNKNQNSCSYTQANSHLQSLIMTGQKMSLMDKGMGPGKPEVYQSIPIKQAEFVAGKDVKQMSPEIRMINSLMKERRDKPRVVRINHSTHISASMNQIGKQSKSRLAGNS